MLDSLRSLEMTEEAPGMTGIVESSGASSRALCSERTVPSRAAQTAVAVSPDRSPALLLTTSTCSEAGFHWMRTGAEPFFAPKYAAVGAK